MAKFIKAINIQVLTLASPDGIPDERMRPLLRLEMIDGRDFMMSGIPTETAYNISFELSMQESQDQRLQIHNIVGQLALVEKVEIDFIVPGTEVYQATIYMKPEGFDTKTITFSMIPSNAILLAVANDAPIYVAEDLIKAADQMKGSSSDDKSEFS